MNVIALTGRLTADPELKKTREGKSVCSITLAVSRPHAKDKTDFISVILWDKLAEFIARFFRKGEFLAIDGYMTQRTYEGSDKMKHTVYEVIAQNCGFCGNKVGNPTEPAEPNDLPEEEPPIAYNDDDLPF